MRIVDLFKRGPKKPPPIAKVTIIRPARYANFEVWSDHVLIFTKEK